MNMKQQNDNLPLVSAVALEKAPSNGELVCETDQPHRSWFQALGSFMVFFSISGMGNMYGVYQDFYQSQNKLDASASAISWIGSVQMALCLVLGIITGPLHDHGYFYHLLYTGSFLVVLGQMMLSLCTSYYQVFLSQGVCMGLGAGLVFLPAFCVLIPYFDRQLEIAIGIATMGGGVGGIVLQIIFNQIVYKIGFSWATRAIGLVLLVPLLIGACILRVKQNSAQTRPLGEFIDWTMFKEPASMVFLLGVVTTSMSIATPGFYVQGYASEINIQNTTLTSYLLSLYLAALTCGCFVLNALAKWVGPFNVISGAVALSGALAWALIDLHNEGGLVFVIIGLGFFSAASYSLPPACYVKLCPDIHRVGSRMGCGYMATTIGSLVGAPIAGAILDRHGYNALWIFTACMSLAGGFTFFISRGLYSGWRMWVVS